jgi:hypothetical protein
LTRVNTKFAALEIFTFRRTAPFASLCFLFDKISIGKRHHGAKSSIDEEDDGQKDNRPKSHKEKGNKAGFSALLQIFPRRNERSSRSMRRIGKGQQGTSRVEGRISPCSKQSMHRLPIRNWRTDPGFLPLLPRFSLAMLHGLQQTCQKGKKGHLSDLRQTVSQNLKRKVCGELILDDVKVDYRLCLQERSGRFFVKASKSMRTPSIVMQLLSSSIFCRALLEISLPVERLSHFHVE